MALYGKSAMDKLIGSDHFSLSDLVKSFNNAINEEQAWAVCFQCAQFFLRGQPQEKYQDLYMFGSQALRLSKDGEVVIDCQSLTSKGSGKGPPDNRNSLFNKGSRIAKEKDAVQALGLAIYHAMDYGMGETEERQLSPDLEDLIGHMTEEDDDDDSTCADDEGIEKDAEDEEDRHRQGKHGYCFYDIAQCCIRHLSSRQDPHHHYKAVCRAVVTEAQELITFLDKISSDQKNLAKKKEAPDVDTVEELQRSDWARLWVQIMRQLRNGVRLKKVEHVVLPQDEFELTPFEILLEDIRSRRYNLNRIMVNGTFPPKVKNDAHAVILDFIRSRPPLRSVKDRKLKSPPPKVHDPHELLLTDIRSMPKLRPIRDGRLVVETSRTKLNRGDSDESPLPVRKVIKPDFTLLLNNSFEEELSDDEGNLGEESRIHVGASQISPLSPVSPVHDHITPVMERPVLRDHTTAERVCKLQRRHTIMVCESPTEGKVIQKELPPLEEDPERELEEEVEFLSQNSSSHYTSPPSYCAGNIRRQMIAHQTSQNNSRQMASERTEHRKSSAGSLSAIPEVDDNCTDHDVSDSVCDVDLSELNASELLHVNWKTACTRDGASNGHSHCQDCRPKPFSFYQELFQRPYRHPYVIEKKWQNPIECLNLTLEEVTHIRTVLTKAELESLITQPELYSQVAKSKLCFSCKITKFALFGEWGTKCRFCKRTVCSKCLRKMHVPTEHFKNIPVYTLSPTPLSPEMKEAIETYKSLSPTGSSPPTPIVPRRPNLDNRPGRKKPLQRSQSMLIKPVTPKVTRGPLMSICCDCKDMVTEIVRAGRTSISLINQGKDPTTEVRLNLIK
ncbi:protein spire homolog 1-like isoform X3 [Haliotis rufescens]|uniref:protein spire homolog 1-like isoform X3 n=1 Tax=Haliotis rufescens TaxID=6454 RepID=UPI00201F5E02|nr:protein spire homolog 1-like isoform X3 [Haliotis rufescens]